MVDLDSEFDRACSALDESNFENLSERDRILVTIWGLEADVNNGGFDQFYFNSSGNQAFFAPAALEKIGATLVSAIVREANSYFGPSGPPSDRDARSSKLEELTKGQEDLFDDLDRRFYEYPDDISALLVAYLEANTLS